MIEKEEVDERAEQFLGRPAVGTVPAIEACEQLFHVRKSLVHALGLRNEPLIQRRADELVHALAGFRRGVFESGAQLSVDPQVDDAVGFIAGR